MISCTTYLKRIVILWDCWWKKNPIFVTPGSVFLTRPMNYHFIKWDKIKKMVVVLSFQGTLGGTHLFFWVLFWETGFLIKWPGKVPPGWRHLIRNIKRGILLYYSSSHPSTFPPLYACGVRTASWGRHPTNLPRSEGGRTSWTLVEAAGFQKINGRKLNAAGPGRGWQPDTPKNCCWKGCGSLDLIWMEWNWLVVFRPTPLKNDGLRQLGLWNSQYIKYMEKWSKCSKPPTREYLWISRNSSCGIFPSESDSLHYTAERLLHPRDPFGWTLKGNMTEKWPADPTSTLVLSSKSHSCPGAWMLKHEKPMIFWLSQLHEWQLVIPWFA